MSITIHLCNYSLQPAIQIWCDETWTEPKWGEHEAPPENVFLADDDRFYTFQHDLVTCLKCLSKT